MMPIFSGTLIAAMLLDALFGEPRWLWDRWPHPAVLMGRVVDWADRRLNTAPAARAKGAIWLASVGVGAFVATSLVTALPGIGPLVEIALGAILLAQKALVAHVRAVADGLRLGLGEGRRAVAQIVGRDTAPMDEAAVARAAIESAAENLSDGVVAPIFWFALLGLPGLVVYKLVNTADSMIGHRTPRHEAFGWAAARLDDVLNFLPARLTALLIALAAWDPRAWQIAQRDAPQHRSPNAGWPEGAMAGALDVAVSGPRSYHGVWADLPWVHGAGNRHPGAGDIDRACAVLWRVWGLCLAGVVVACVL